MLPQVLGVAPGLRCSVVCEILVPRPGIKPASRVLQGRFLTTGPAREVPFSPFLCKFVDRLDWQMKETQAIQLKQNWSHAVYAAVEVYRLIYLQVLKIAIVFCDLD